jgi:SAM-dependent methyltransferase
VRPKWLIEDDGRPATDRRLFWTDEHVSRDYERTFSVGEDADVTSRVVDATLAGAACDCLLVAGCGSRVELQRCLLDRAPSMTEVVASDFPSVIARAEERFIHPRLKYVTIEESKDWKRRFDVVVAVNVLIMERDVDNRSLLGRWAQMLKPGGTLVALLPTLFCGLDLAMLSGRDDLFACLDLERSSWREAHQGIGQIEYSPLRLRRVLAEAGLRLDDLRIVFLASPDSRRQAREHYALDDEDLLVYEQLVVATRC